MKTDLGTIVVVEDDPNIADLVDLYLRREGFRVLQAGDGERGLELVARECPRLVVLDVGLPGAVDGLELCRRLLASDAAGGAVGTVPVVMLTARPRGGGPRHPGAGAGGRAPRDQARSRGPGRCAGRAGRRAAAAAGSHRPAPLAAPGGRCDRAGAPGARHRLARRFARPVSAAAEAARRIAAGDLAVRVDPGGPGAEVELARLAASINTMAADLERARGLQRQFLLSVSHELRTPLTSVRGFAEAIADGAAPDTQRAAEVIGAEARRMERLVGDLLDLAKLEARSFSLRIEAVDVDEVVWDTADAFRPAAIAAGLSLEVAAGPDPNPPGDGADGRMASADRERLAQVVANLVENALKFAASRITVSVAREGGHVVVAVVDDGPGVAEEDLPHVFERMFQSSRAPARQAGSGLGLAIVAELAAAMEARVEARSGPGATRMAVHLPAAPVDTGRTPRP